jgi:hypothetical protein
MSCILTCKCGATCLGLVTEDDPETNSFSAEPTFPEEWEGGDPLCSHEDYTVTHDAYDDWEER